MPQRSETPAGFGPANHCHDKESHGRATSIDSATGPGSLHERPGQRIDYQ